MVVLGALLFLFEEVLWAGLGHLMAKLARLPPVVRLEQRIRTLRPYPAMVLFLLPLAIALPIDLLGGWLVTRGRLVLGLVLLIAGKLLGTAFLARLYHLCHPALRGLPWFVRLETMILRWSAWAHALLDQIESWQRTRAAVRRVLALAKTFFAVGGGWLGRRFNAARRFVRRRMTLA